MAVKQFISGSIKFTPQAGFSLAFTENGGAEATQDFITKSAKIGTSDLAAFNRGSRWEELWPEVPSIYRNLTLKVADPTDMGNGMVLVKCTFTGYAYAGNGSSGEEQEVPTSSLVGNLEETPINEHPKWGPLGDAEKARLGWLLSGASGTTFNIGSSEYGRINEETNNFEAFPTDLGIWAIPTGDELQFARLIAQNKTTYKKGSWTYSYHTESETGFTATQLNSLGKIVANPPGSPTKPATGWTWLLVSPNQGQSGTKRFVKTLDFLLIQENDENTFLYES